MSATKIINALTDLQLIKFSKLHTSALSVAKHLEISENTRNLKLINDKLKSLNIKWKTKVIYEKITKECPVCLDEFETSKNSPREKHTCSYSCSNTYFRSGINNGSYIKAAKADSISSKHYRSICFHHHKKECIICNENRIVEVHHADENHENNDPKNLIPLCPNHHRLYHSRYINDVLPQIQKYIEGLDL